MSKILVTGASGFIGKRTALYFMDRGYDVIGWNRSRHQELFETQAIDFSNLETITRTLEKTNPAIIVHCAGSANVNQSVRDPITDYESNVSLTHKLLFSIHKMGMKNIRFVFLSSAAVYGNPEILPITEDMQRRPLSPYAVHKQMCEDLCSFFSENYGMDIKVARVFSAYGEGLKKQIFWDLYNKYLSSETLELYGTGNESRDYIYVNDVAQALFLLSTAKSNDLFFNVANGEEISIMNVAYSFAKCVGLNPELITFNGYVREGDPLNWCADISKLKELGYEKTTCLDEGLSRYIEWANGYRG